MGLAGPFGIGATAGRFTLQRIEDRLDRVAGEAAVDRRLAGANRRRPGIGGKTGEGFFDPAAPGERRDQCGHPLSRRVMRRKTAIERIGGADPDAAQAEIAADPSRTEIEKACRADIGKQPNAGFRHRQHRALGRDSISAVDRDAGAAAHRDPVDDRDIGLRVAADAADQLVFLTEKRGRQGVVAGEAATRFVDRPDVTAGAEGALAGAADQHRLDAGVLGPGAQHRIEAAVHVERKGVEGLRPVQRYGRDPALASKQDVLWFRHARPVGLS